MRGIILKIHEREIEFNFGLAFMGQVLKTLDMSIDEVVANIGRNPFLLIPTLMYVAAKHAESKKKRVIEYTQDEFTDWLELSGGISQESVVDFLAAFTKSLEEDVVREKEVTGSKKK